MRTNYKNKLYEQTGENKLCAVCVCGEEKRLREIERRKKKEERQKKEKKEERERGMKRHSLSDSSTPAGLPPFHERCLALHGRDGYRVLNPLLPLLPPPLPLLPCVVSAGLRKPNAIFRCSPLGLCFSYLHLHLDLHLGLGLGR